MRILLAEDDPVIADGICRALRRGGCAVDHVADGMEADAALAGQGYDLLILDLGLPRMNGIEVLSACAQVGSAGADPDRAGWRRRPRARARCRCRRLPPKPFALARTGSACVLTRRGTSQLALHRDRPADTTRPTAWSRSAASSSSCRRARSACSRSSCLRVGPPWSRDQPVDHPCGWGEVSEQRDRGLCPSPAQEAGGQRRAHRDRARPGVLPGKPDAGPCGGQAAADDAAADVRAFNSLFGEILDWMLAPLLFLWPISIIVTHNVADSIANQPTISQPAGHVRASRAWSRSRTPGWCAFPAPPRAVPRRPGRRRPYYQVPTSMASRSAATPEIPPIADLVRVDPRIWCSYATP